MTWFLSSGSAGEQVAIHQSGRTSPLGPAKERRAGGGPVQTATQAASEERISGVTRSEFGWCSGLHDRRSFP